jgi:hypothetical protein
VPNNDFGYNAMKVNQFAWIQNVKVPMACVLLALCIGVSLPALGAGERSWTDIEGREMRGELVSATATEAKLRVGGKVALVPLARLSDADKAFVSSERIRLHEEAKQEHAAAQACLEKIQESLRELSRGYRESNPLGGRDVRTGTIREMRVRLPDGSLVTITSSNKGQVLKDAERRLELARRSLRENPGPDAVEANQ